MVACSSSIIIFPIRKLKKRGGHAHKLTSIRIGVLLSAAIQDIVTDCHKNECFIIQFLSARRQDVAILYGQIGPLGLLGFP